MLFPNSIDPWLPSSGASRHLFPALSLARHLSPNGESLSPRGKAFVLRFVFQILFSGELTQRKPCLQGLVSRQKAEKMFVKLVIMNNFRKFRKYLDIKAVLYRIVLYQTNKINRR